MKKTCMFLIAIGCIGFVGLNGGGVTTTDSAQETVKPPIEIQKPTNHGDQHLLRYS